MNLDQAMEAQKGPAAVVLPHEGTRFVLDQPGVAGQIKMAPGEYPHFKFSAVRYDIAPGARLDCFATLLAGRMLYCLEGEGEVALNGQTRPFFTEVFVHLGEGHHATVTNTGTGELQVFVFTFGTSPDGRRDLLEETTGGPTLRLTADLRRIFALLDLEPALALPDDLKGDLTYQLPDAGPSWWQARPTAGWVEVKLAPFTNNVHHYAVLMQTLFPGSRVREHAHNQLNEFLLITKGTASAALHLGEDVICPKGSVIIIGRNVFHRWANAGEGDAQNFGIIDPPGVEGALAFTGRLREKGSEWPTDIVRNAETGKMLHDRFGFVIGPNEADGRR